MSLCLKQNCHCPARLVPPTAAAVRRAPAGRQNHRCSQQRGRVGRSPRETREKELRRGAAAGRAAVLQGFPQPARGVRFPRTLAAARGPAREDIHDAWTRATGTFWAGGDSSTSRDKGREDVKAREGGGGRTRALATP